MRINKTTTTEHTYNPSNLKFLTTGTTNGAGECQNMPETPQPEQAHFSASEIF